jgi:hypothetical protein
MNDKRQDQLKQRLLELQQEHRDLDAAINAMTDQRVFDQLQLQRLKKRKLQLKDDISRTQDTLYPDIIA